MRKTITVVISGLSLLLSGCNRMETSNPSEESCVLCHSASLSLNAVHRVHLSRKTMATFPYLGMPVDSTLDSNSQTRLLAYHFECTACHSGFVHDSNAVYNGYRVNPAIHRNGNVDILFDSLYMQRRFASAGAASFDYVAETCNNIACHGYGRSDTLGVTWSHAPINEDSLTGTQLNCNACHNVGVDHHPGASVAMNCNACHPGTVVKGKFTLDISKHINGVVDTNGEAPNSPLPL